MHHFLKYCNRQRAVAAVVGLSIANHVASRAIHARSTHIHTAPVQLVSARARTIPAASSALFPSSDSLLQFDSSAAIMGTLPNGMRYIVRRNIVPAKRAELRLVVKAGSLHEDDDQRGLAHFVEHMAFNGTARFPHHDIIDYLRSIGVRFGADLNANTTFDRTLYILPIPTDTAAQVARAIQILADWAHGISFDPAEFDAERGVIMGEWRSRLGAGTRLTEQQIPVLYQGSRYPSRVTIGDTAIILHAPVSRVRAFYHDWYRPDLMTVIAVGDFDPDSIARLIRTELGTIPTAVERRATPDMSVPIIPGSRVLVVHDPEVANATLAMTAMRADSIRWTTGTIRHSLVSSLFASLINERLGEMPLRADAPFVNAGISEGRLNAFVATRQLSVTVNDGDLARAVDAVMAEIDRVAQHGFTASEIDRATHQYTMALDNHERNRGSIRSAVWADQYVESFLSGRPVTRLEDDIALTRTLLATVTPAELQAQAARWHDVPDRVVTITLPERAAGTVPDTAQIAAALDGRHQHDVAAYVDAVGNAPLLDTLPTPGTIVSERNYPAVGVTEWHLSNGITVLLKPTTYVSGEVAFKAWGPGGYYNAPDSDAATSMVSNLLVGLGGAGAYDLPGLRKRIGANSATLSRGVTSTDRLIGGEAAWKDVETLWQLTYLSVTKPRYDSAAFALALQRAKETIEHEVENPERAFRDTIAVTLSQRSPWTIPSTPQVLDRIDPHRAFEFVKARYANMGDFVFAIVGDFVPDSIRPYVLRYLASLPSTGRHEEVRDVGIRPPSGITTRTVYAGQEPQAQTKLYFYGPYEHSAINGVVFNEMIEIVKARLLDRLREQLGGTYSVSAEGAYQLQPTRLYSVTLSFISAPERRDELTAAAFAVLETLKRDGPTDAEMQSVHEEALRQLQSAQQSNGFWLDRLLRFAREDRPFGTLLDSHLVTDVTARMVRDAARHYLDTTQYAQFVLLPTTHADSGAMPSLAWVDTQYTTIRRCVAQHAEPCMRRESARILDTFAATGRPVPQLMSLAVVEAALAQAQLAREAMHPEQAVVAIDRALQLLAPTDLNRGNLTRERWQYDVVGRPFPTVMPVHWLPGATTSATTSTATSATAADTAALSSGVRLIMYTAHWCGPCQSMYPIVRALAQRYGPQALHTVLLTELYGYFKSDRDLTPAQELDADRAFYRTAYHFDIPIGVSARDQPGLLHGAPALRGAPAHAMGVTSMPTFLIVDSSNTIRYARAGTSGEVTRELVAHIEALLPTRAVRAAVSTSDSADRYTARASHATLQGHPDEVTAALARAAQIDSTNPARAQAYAASLGDRDTPRARIAWTRLATRFPFTREGHVAREWLARMTADSADRVRQYDADAQLLFADRRNIPDAALREFFLLYAEAALPQSVAFAARAAATDTVSYSSVWWNQQAVAGARLEQATMTMGHPNDTTVLALLDSVGPGIVPPYVEQRSLLRAAVLAEHGAVAAAYDTLVIAMAMHPSDRVAQALARVGATHGRTTAEIDADVRARRIAVASTAPPFQAISSRTHHPITLDSLRGKVVLFTFWFPGCAPCREEFPYFQRIADRYRDQGLVILAANGNPEQESLVLPFLQGNHYSFEPVQMREPIDSIYAPHAFPANRLIDRHGRLIWRGFHALDDTDARRLEFVIESVLKEPIQ